MEAALDILAREGSHGLTTRNLARALGITEPALYRHFESKKDLLKALYGFVATKMERTLSPALKEENPFPTKIRNLLTTLLDYLKENRGVNLVLLSEAIHHNDPDLKRAMEKLIKRVQGFIKGVITQGIKEGTLREDLNHDMASRIIIGLFQVTVTFSILTDEPWNTGETVESFLPIFLEGVLK